MRLLQIAQLVCKIFICQDHAILYNNLDRARICAGDSGSDQKKNTCRSKDQSTTGEGEDVGRGRWELYCIVESGKAVCGKKWGVTGSLMGAFEKIWQLVKLCVLV